MENQHRKITGYRELGEAEINAMNEIKRAAEEIEALVASIRNRPAIAADPRWLAIAATDLQKGFMALTRSVAKPTSF